MVWIVKGNGSATGNAYKYEVKDHGPGTPAMTVLLDTFQRHAIAKPTDMLKTDATAEWISDSVTMLDKPVSISSTVNYIIQVQDPVTKGWDKHSERATRKQASATSALEAAAEADKKRAFRILRTTVSEEIIAEAFNGIKDVQHIASEKLPASATNITPAPAEASKPAEDVKAEVTKPAEDVKPSAAKVVKPGANR